MREPITEQMKIHEQWYEDAKTQTLATLSEFLRHLSEDYQHDYGTVCHALSAAAVATCWAMNRSPGANGGITGFQSGCVMWGFVQHWLSTNGPLKMVHYENMIYPQYARDFEKTITQDTADWLKTKARRVLDERGDGMDDEVRAHMELVASGYVPFGYIVSER